MVAMITALKASSIASRGMGLRALRWPAIAWSVDSSTPVLCVQLYITAVDELDTPLRDTAKPVSYDRFVKRALYRLMFYLKIV